MPWGDGTGPRGFGPMTGRAAGYCAGYPAPGYMHPGGAGYGWGRGFGWSSGRGYGRGFGRGRGWRWGYPYPDPYYPPASYYRYPPGYRYDYLYTPPSSYPRYTEPISRGAIQESEKAYLEERVHSIEEELRAIKQRLEELSEE